MTLADYVQAEAGKPFRLGLDDCAHFIAGWVAARTGRDGLAVFGGLGADTAARLIADRQLLRAVFTGSRSIQLQRTRAPEPGDIGVIRTEGRHRCAIRGSHGWLYRDEAGIGSTNEAQMLMAWKVD